MRNLSININRTTAIASRIIFASQFCAIDIYGHAIRIGRTRRSIRRHKNCRPRRKLYIRAYGYHRIILRSFVIGAFDCNRTIIWCRLINLTLTSHR